MIAVAILLAAVVAWAAVGVWLAGRRGWYQ